MTWRMDTTARNILSDLDKGGWSIICDFDGTIARIDVTDAILDRFADPAWEDVEKEWLNGTITARRCMESQVRLIKAAPADIDAFLKTVPITRGFAEFIRFCAESNLSILVVSDGIDHAVKRVLAGNGYGNIPVIANRLRFQEESGYRLDFPYSSEGCKSGVCKCDVSKAVGGKILLIGDGRSDICLASVASFVLAKRGKPLHLHCEENAIPHAVYNDFFDVLNYLASACKQSEGCNADGLGVAL